MVSIRKLLLQSLVGSSLLACSTPPPPTAQATLTAPASAAVSAAMVNRDFAYEACRKRVAAAARTPPATGAPGYDRRRAEILGRGLGNPVVFLDTPRLIEGPSTHVELIRTLRRHRHLGQPRAELRSKILRDGYLYTDDPELAYGFVKELRLDLLFDEDVIWRYRGDELTRLEKRTGRRPGGGRTAFMRKGHYYVEAETGRYAQILLFDRVGSSRESVEEDTLHIDVSSFSRRLGFDRIRFTHLHPQDSLAELRFEGVGWTPVLLDTSSPAIQLRCHDAPQEKRAAIAAAATTTAPRRGAVAGLQRAIDDMVDERLPFDRPHGAEDHLDDGQLRAKWEWAFKKGHIGFLHNESGYPVFDDRGRPIPPQMCVSFIIDSYERASGTWYTARSSASRQRLAGALDFNDLGIKNRAGVMAYERFAEEHPEVMEASRFPARIEFRERKRFFQNLVTLADRFRPGDVVAIQGPKPDGYIHQHAILIEDVDPITGMPHALADQMTRPRRRTWEMIMREAPRRALLFQVRLKNELFLKLNESAPSLPVEVANDAR